MCWTRMIRRTEMVRETGSGFSERFVAIIEKMGISRREFAKRCGFTEASVCRYVHGNRLPNYDTVLKIKRTSGCTWEELFGE